MIIPFCESSAGWMTHRWTGWPGAVCQDCGIEDPLELCIIDHGLDDCDNCPGSDPTCSLCFGTGCLPKTCCSSVAPVCPGPGFSRTPDSQDSSE